MQLLFCGVPEGIRTPDLLVRSQLLYPAELQTHLYFEHLQVYYLEAHLSSIFLSLRVFCCRFGRRDLQFCRVYALQTIRYFI